MSVRGKILWAASAVLLVFLYLASSTDLIIKEKVREIHTVSIVLDDVNDTYYQNLRRAWTRRPGTTTRTPATSPSTRRSARRSRLSWWTGRWGTERTPWW